MLVIYENEVNVIIEKIKDDFTSEYQNLYFSINRDVENGLLKGLIINISLFKGSKLSSKYVDTKGFFTLSSYIDYIGLTISELVNKTLSDTYFKNKK